MTEALELAIERAWCAIDDQLGKRLFYLTPTHEIATCKNELCVPRGGIIIGWFTRAIHLADFRAEVFGVFEQMTRGH